MPAVVITTVVSIFADQAAARDVLDQLAGHGVSRHRIKLHEGLPTARNATMLEVDEYLSGGFISNISALFDGLFGHHIAEGKAATYADLVRTEGTLVSVQAQGLEEARRCEMWLREAGAVRVSILPEKDTVSFHRLYPH